MYSARISLLQPDPNSPIYVYESGDLDQIMIWLKYQIPNIDTAKVKVNTRMSVNNFYQISIKQLEELPTIEEELTPKVTLDNKNLKGDK